MWNCREELPPIIWATILQAVRGDVHSVFAAMAGSWRHERFHQLCQPNLVKFWNTLTLWWIPTLLDIYYQQQLFFLFFFLPWSKVKLNSHTHTFVVLLLTKHDVSTLIMPASETHRVCWAVCLSVQTSEAALISLGILAQQRQRSFQKPPENKICPNQSRIAQEYFHKRKKDSRTRKGFIALQQLGCLSAPVLSAAMQTFMTSWYICTMILQKTWYLV